MKKSVGLVAAAIIAGSLMVGPSASAVDWPSDCASAKMCLYDYYDFVSRIAIANEGLSLANLPAGYTDKMASWANHSATYNGAWYSAINGGGSCYTMTKNSVNAALLIWERDTADSWKTYQGC